jgi:hypothetical protein
LASLLFVKIRRGAYAKDRGKASWKFLPITTVFWNNKGTKKRSEPPSRRDSALLPGFFVVHQNQADWPVSRPE